VWVPELPDIDLFGFTETTSNSWHSAAEATTAVRMQMRAPRIDRSRMFIFNTKPENSMDVAKNLETSERKRYAWSFYIFRSHVGRTIGLCRLP
jgi:hypothetical protein